MRALLVLTCLVFGVGLAVAEKPPVEIESVPANRVPCEIANVVYDWHFNDSDHGFTLTACDEQGATVWEYGTVPEAPDWGNIWVTQLYNPYPNDAGEGLLSPVFLVDETSFLVEIEITYSIELGYDGVNVKANGELIHPIEGYPVDIISESDTWYTWCVDGQPGFSGASGGWVLQCFDLYDYMGQDIQLRIDFGSDSAVQGGGFGLRYVRIGGDVVANERAAWSHIKGLYR